jgi:hypothetical protein
MTTIVKGLCSDCLDAVDCLGDGIILGGFLTAAGWTEAGEPLLL